YYTENKSQLDQNLHNQVTFLSVPGRRGSRGTDSDNTGWARRRSTTSVGSSRETRPTNVAVFYYIKINSIW
ncbi:MAG: hypothetical protein KDA84_15315, partial [Planctomycetaceae bacterium]|nr:hypothetical protein [Planctomycetaceae bacterium]